MGKPRLIILIRHAESTGNENRSVHQSIPDHRVPLTTLGHEQALQAGSRLAALLQPTDTLQIITSPYQRTRETTLGILSSPELATHPCASTIKVYEEPRLREQDFGNFQPCQAEMTRMWHERAAYGHFFYRIPNGESAADAYDRCAGFNESLWRQFASPNFPSVCVLVTHGLMTRIFLMKWYHYSVEHFEDLKNVGHTEMIIMERNERGKYDLKTPLRTWSGKSYDRQRELARYRCPPVDTDWSKLKSPTITSLDTSGLEQILNGRKWGGCVNGCSHSAEGLAPRDKTKGIMQAGRDFGGSRSGAPSMVGSDSEPDDDFDDENQAEDDGLETPANVAKNSCEPSAVMERLILEEKREAQKAKQAASLQVSVVDTTDKQA
ncbi:phosphoglycerate mutase-like protein [Ascodesmis nigricans]|uniref:Phosphoglycerate mutase-like protein n=1 Tax=Ascodesmis nigricans TaxID=341454 RepID=A0A4S2N3M7_9PEZI|nr:phosphoglycerate mutase-like protein [Ascodesmis nigricans]